MLPCTDDDPAGVVERRVRAAGTGQVPTDLVRPVGAVRLGNTAVIRAAVPEAAIDKDCDALSGEDRVGRHSRSDEWSDVLSEAEPTPVELRPEGDFGARVSPPVPLHDRAHSGGGGWRSGWLWAQEAFLGSIT